MDQDDLNAGDWHERHPGNSGTFPPQGNRPSSRDSHVSLTISPLSERSASTMASPKSPDKSPFHGIAEIRERASSDAYFVHNSISEMRAVYDKLRAESEAQNKELHSRIGNRYGDVIEASTYLRNMFFLAENIVASWDDFVNRLSELLLQNSPSSISLVQNRWKDQDFVDLVELKQGTRLVMYQLYAIRTLPEKVYRWIILDYRYMDCTMLLLLLMAIKESKVLGEMERSPKTNSWTTEMSQVFDSFWDYQMTRAWFPAIHDALDHVLADAGKSPEALVWASICYMIIMQHADLDTMQSHILELRLERLIGEFFKIQIQQQPHASVAEVLIYDLVKKIVMIVSQVFDVIERFPEAVSEAASRWNPTYWRGFFDLHLDRRLVRFIENVQSFGRLSIPNVMRRLLSLSVSRISSKDCLDRARLSVAQNVHRFLETHLIDAKRLNQARIDIINNLKKDTHLHREWIWISQKCLEGCEEPQSLWSFFFEDSFKQYAESLIERHSRSEEMQGLLMDIASYSILDIQREFRAPPIDLRQPRFVERVIHLLESWIINLFSVTYELQMTSTATYWNLEFMGKAGFSRKLMSNWKIGDSDLFDQGIENYGLALFSKLEKEIRMQIIEVVRTLEQKRLLCDSASMAIYCLWCIRFIAKLILDCPVMKRVVFRSTDVFFGSNKENGQKNSLFKLFEDAHVKWLTDYLKLVLYSRLECKGEDTEIENSIRDLLPVRRKIGSATTTTNVDPYASMAMSEFLKSLLDDISCLMRYDLGETPFVPKTREIVSLHFIMAICSFYHNIINKSFEEHIYMTIYNDLIILNDAFPSVELGLLINECSSKVMRTLSSILNKIAMIMFLSEFHFSAGSCESSCVRRAIFEDKIPC
jgi:hypothetical protein